MAPHRVNIINTMQLIASARDQLEYQNSSQVNVASELVNQWFCDFYHPADPRFMSAFSDKELKALRDFNSFFDCRVHALPETLGEMLASQAWEDVIMHAQIVLDKLGWQGLEARYEC